jgi:hypothetical protein
MAFKVQGEIAMDGSKFFGVMGRAGAAVNRFGSTVTQNVGGRLAAAFSVGAAGAFAKSIITMASGLRDAADATKLNVEWMQKWASSAAKTGGNLEDIKKFSLELQKNRQEAVNDPKGGKGQAFAKLGISATDVATAPQQKLIEQIMAAFKDGASADEVNSVREVGGKAAVNLIGAFKDGIDENARIIPEDMVDQLDEMDDAMTGLGLMLKSFFAPVIIFVVDAIKAGVNNLQTTTVLLTAIFAGILNGFNEMIENFKKGNIRKGFAAFANGLEEGVTEGMANAEEEIRRQDKEAADLKAGLAAKRKRRNEGENAPEDYKPEDKKEAVKKAAAVASDSLVSVGNFLGTSRNAIADLAKRQVELLIEIAKNTKQPPLSNTNGSGFP